MPFSQQKLDFFTILNLWDTTYKKFWLLEEKSLFQLCLLPSPNGEYANYNGSLTTPGCNEAVQWILFKEPIQISASQMEAFRALLDAAEEPMVDNYRPTQPLNGRQVNFYTA